MHTQELPQNASPVVSDAIRKHRETQKDRVLNAIRNAGNEGAYNSDLNKICFRYSACIHILRHEGHLIETVVVDVTNGLWKFVYTGHAEDLF